MKQTIKKSFTPKLVRDRRCLWSVHRTNAMKWDILPVVFGAGFAGLVLGS